MSAHRGKVVLLPPNRVWRAYQGGALLDRAAGVPPRGDSHFPEDWMGSVTRAINPGRESVREGISQVQIAGESRFRDFQEMLAADPDYFLGAAHLSRHGIAPMLLVKLLDPAIRLHFQVHPTAAFARKFLGSPSGKTEAYHILQTRPGSEPYVYLGFQRPPAKSELRRMIQEQDIAAIERCFDRIPVKAGDTLLVPGGVPHALGEGLLLVEIQEPTDLVVRFEFERGGYVLPESSRFMGRDLEFALGVFDFTPRSRAEIDRTLRCAPRRETELGPGSWTDALIGQAQTDCFRVKHTRVTGSVTRNHDTFQIAVVTGGTCTVTAGGEATSLRTLDKIFVPAGIGAVTFTASPHAELLECHPPL
jgi:mannose-6-phosphate isomerase